MRTFTILCRLDSNLIRLFSSLSRCSPTSKSVTESVIAEDDVRRKLPDNTIVASDSFSHAISH